MMFWETEIFLPAMTVLATSGFIVGCFRMRAKAHRERAHDLRIAYMALEEFYRSVNKVVDDPSVSDDMKILLLTMSEAMPDRNAARYLVHELTTNGFAKRRPSSESESMIAEWRSLAKTRPDMVEEIVKAFKAGLSALILRWPETSARFKEASAALIDERTEIAAVKKISRFAIEHPHNKDHRMASNLAAA